MSTKQAMLAKIHIAKKELNLTDDNYRALLQGVTGKTSTKGMSLPEMDEVLIRLKEHGWKPKPIKRADHPQARKCRALWYTLYKAGVIQSNKESSLIAFGKRQTGIDSLTWIREPKECGKIIEALKAMAKRYGVSLEY